MELDFYTTGNISTSCMYVSMCVYVRMRMFGCLLYICMQTSIAHEIYAANSTTKDLFDEQMLVNYRCHTNRSLQCKTCAPHGLRKDTALFYCTHCAREYEASHFPDKLLKNWKQRGRKGGILTCQPRNQGRPPRKN